MDFCPICPTAHLARFAGGSRTHLVLAQHYGRDATYAEWHRGRVASGDTVILDNGAYEGELVEPKELLRVVLDLKPTVVVLPDAPGRRLETQRLSSDFAFLLKTVEAEVQTLQVIHAEDGNLKEFVEAFTIAALTRHWVALSRLTQSYGLLGEVPAMRRVQFIKHLETLGLWRRKNILMSWVKLHCLGLLNGQVVELPELAKLGVNSIDSSAPIWRGLLGYNIAHPEQWNSWPDVPFDPQDKTPTVRENLLLAERNLKFVEELCQSHKHKNIT